MSEGDIRAMALELPTDAAIGLNIAAIRGARDLSQADVAEDMSNLGFSWHQQTVWKVEKGQRPLRFEEAAALARLLKVSLDNLVQIPELLRPTEQLRKAVEAFEVMTLETYRQICRTLEAREALRKKLSDTIEKWGWELTDVSPEGKLVKRVNRALAWEPEDPAKQARERLARNEKMHVVSDDGTDYLVEVDEPDVPPEVRRDKDWDAYVHDPNA